MSLDGDRVVVGAYNDGFAQGSAYVFDFDGSTWNQIKLAAIDGVAGDSFGYSVSLDDDRVLVGAQAGNMGRGAAYVFDFDGSTWNQTKLSASDGVLGDSFGWSVSLDGDRVLVGAWGDNSRRGAAYVFDFSDSDGDGVPDSLDVCPGTVLPEDMPESPKRNRYYAQGDGKFVDVDGVWSGITVADTGGCSGIQIIEQAGLGEGHVRFGITRSALLDWIASLP